MLFMVIALALALAGGVATLLALMAKGWLTLDTGWGRSYHEVGPLVVRFDAPRELVFQQLAAPYLGRAPKDMHDELEVFERGDNLVVAAHHTDLGPYTSTTVEVVTFEEPTRISFRHLRGPVPHALEEFVLTDLDEGTTELTYRGELGLDWWLAGRLAARSVVVPTWVRQVSDHLEKVKPTVEDRAQRHRQRAARRQDEQRSD